MSGIRLRVFDRVSNLMSLDMELPSIEAALDIKEPEDILMRYTAAADARGQDVCEADILESLSGYRYEIMWTTAGFYCRGIAGAPRKLAFVREHIHICCVVGNRYEQPGLL